MNMPERPRPPRESAPPPPPPPGGARRALALFILAGLAALTYAAVRAALPHLAELPSLGAGALLDAKVLVAALLFGAEAALATTMLRIGYETAEGDTFGDWITFGLIAGIIIVLELIALIGLFFPGPGWLVILIAILLSLLALFIASALIWPGLWAATGRQVCIVLVPTVWAFFDWIIEQYTECAAWGLKTYNECALWGRETWSECAEWGTKTREECADWVVTQEKRCISWVKVKVAACRVWLPSWLGWVCAIQDFVLELQCDAFALITVAVCVAFYFVVQIVCLLWFVAVAIVCLLWIVAVEIVCLLFLAVFLIIAVIWMLLVLLMRLLYLC